MKEVAAASSSSAVCDSVEKKYTCKTCGRNFNSFQALGGHCASHNKFKLVNTEIEADVASVGKSKSHACPICGIEFPIGQALGGHMRRHRPLAARVADASSDRSSITTISEVSVRSDDNDVKKVVVIGKKRKQGDVGEGELLERVVKKVSSERVCLDLGLSISPWEDEKDSVKGYEIEEGEIIEEEEKEEYDFLKLELRLPISGLLTY